MSEIPLKDRMARAIAAAVYRSQGNTEDDRREPVMAERRKAAEDAAVAALACIQAGDDIGSDLTVVQRSQVAE